MTVSICTSPLSFLLSVLFKSKLLLSTGTVNESGESCPYALKAVAVHLLLEITTYLRETHQYLPKARGPSFRKETVVWERQGTKVRKASQPFSSHGSDHSPGGSLAGSPTTELPGGEKKNTKYRGQDRTKLASDWPIEELDSDWPMRSKLPSA